MRTLSAIPAPQPWEKQINAALAAFAQMRYVEALDRFQDAYAEAEKAGPSPELRGRILRGMGACWLGLSDYKKALAQFQAARPYTILGGDREGLAALDANIASTYVYQGDLKTGEEIYRRALSCLAEIPDSPHRAAILANLALANLLGRQYRAALRLLPAALKAAEHSDDHTTEANIHDFFGFAYLGLGDYPRARAAFEHSVGARQSLGPGADLTRPLLLLGRTELEAGNPGAALDQLDRCVASAEQRDSRFDLWQALYFRARAQLALGKSEIALTDLKHSVSVLESIRPGLLANDSIRLLYEVNHHEVYGVLADLLCGMDRSAEAFQAVELGRAQSLRALLEERPAPAAKRAQNARAAIVGNADGTALEAAEATTSLIECQRKILSPESLLLNYYLGSKGAYLWAVTDSEARFYRLPPPAQWSGGVRQFVEAIQAPGADARLIGERLYQALLGPVEKSMLEKRHWIIAADGDLVVLPFCALPLPPLGSRATGSRAQAESPYVIEKHSVSYVPSVSVLAALGRQTPAEYEYDFLGMADPVVNRADSRWHGSPPQAMPGSKALPRLVASEAEIRACGRAFDPERLRLMTGFQVSMSGIEAARQHSYRYWHLASHVVADTEHPDSSFVALSISRATSQTGGGRLEKLTASDIVGLKISTEMVLVNGCDSGSGKNLPGAGVVGLARAFLAAGARSVCATRWRMPDEGGDLAAGLYRRLAQSHGQQARDRAEALRQAQLDMISAADWRAQPRYWAAYFLMGAGS